MSTIRVQTEEIERYTKELREFNVPERTIRTILNDSIKTRQEALEKKIYSVMESMRDVDILVAGYDIIESVLCTEDNNRTKLIEKNIEDIGNLFLTNSDKFLLKLLIAYKLLKSEDEELEEAIRLLVEGDPETFTIKETTNSSSNHMHWYDESALFFDDERQPFAISKEVEISDAPEEKHIVELMTNKKIFKIIDQGTEPLSPNSKIILEGEVTYDIISHIVPEGERPKFTGKIVLTVKKADESGL